MSPANGRFQARVYSSWADFEPLWSELLRGNGALPFQNPHWMKTWFDCFAPATSGTKVQPVLVAISEPSSGRNVMLLPLVHSRSGMLDQITFADFSVTDCNAPVLSDGVPQDPEGSAELWACVLAALPRADRMNLDKMPRTVGDLVNPLVLTGEAKPCIYSQNLTGVTNGWPAYLASLDRHHRKELGRSLRLFEAAGKDAKFRFASDSWQGHAILDFIDAAQRERLNSRGVRHVFADAAHSRFYRDLVTSGTGGDTLFISALELDGGIVAGLMVLAAHPRAVLIRIANTGGDLARIGLGRLIIERTLNALNARGFTEFDFSIGDGDHKRRFAARPRPLWTLQRRLSWRAIPAGMGDDAIRFAKGVPALRRLAARVKLLGQRWKTAR